MIKKLDDCAYHTRRETGAKKITVYMNAGHKWLVEEWAHVNRISQKQALYEMIEHYWNNVVPHTKKME